jgi:hypothetical protein
MNGKRITYHLLKYFIFPVTFFCVSNGIDAQQKVLNINKDISSVPLGKYVYLFNDAESMYKDSEVVHSAQFLPVNKDIPVSPDVIKGSLWAKFKVVNSTADSIFFLNLQYSNLSELTLYEYQNGLLKTLSVTGNDFDFDKKTRTSPDFIFPIRLHQSDTAEFYLKIKSNHPLLLPLFIKSKDKLDEGINLENLIFGLYFGIILSIFLYNVFLFISTRDLSYLFYIIYLFFLGLAQTTVSGYGFKYFWPHSQWLNNYDLIITT